MNKYLGILAVILASLLWGTTGTAATFAPALSPLFIGSFAMGMGGFCNVDWLPLRLFMIVLYWQCIADS